MAMRDGNVRRQRETAKREGNVRWQCETATQDGNARRQHEMAMQEGNARRQHVTAMDQKRFFLSDGNGSEEIFSYRTFNYAAIVSLVYTTAASEGEGQN